MKHILNFLSSLVVAVLMAVAISMATGLSFLPVLAGLLVASALLSLVRLPQGAAMAVVLKQMWEAELLRAFRATRSWPSRIPRKDEYVGNNAINVQEVGADPTVLINNSSYPIAVASRTDDTTILALNKYETTNTSVSRSEIEALPYDKEGSVISQHKEVLIERTGEHGLWNLCPAGNTASTPVIATTGADNGAGRKRLKVADLITLKARLDALKVPQAGRILVLCGDHVADLLMEDLSFQIRYNNTKTGEVIPQYGFEIFEDVFCNVFTDAGAKKAFGAAAAPSTDRNASTLFFAPRAFQASGTTEMFYQDKYSNPRMRQTEVGFTQYHIIGPVKNLGFGAIASAIV
jgi:hypothetical protein